MNILIKFVNNFNFIIYNFMSKIVLGIDLGTTNSVGSIWNGTLTQLLKIINLDYFPSVINFTDHGKIMCVK